MIESSWPASENMPSNVDRVVVNLGPQHPSTHGVFRLVLTLEGETIVDADTVVGYLHRGTEKLAEEGTYQQIVPYTDRLDYLSGMLNNFAYVLAVEKVAALQIPVRAEYLRVITAELSRIASHMVFVGTFAADLGTFFTPLMYAFRDRERIMDLFELICGARLTVSYHRVGGVAADAPQGWIDSCKAFVDYLPSKIDEYEALLTNNEIVIARTKGVGAVSPQLAIDYGITGPVLRATGLAYDIRRARPYSIYPTLDFDIPTGTTGDCYDRFLVRVREMRQSVRILQQALDRIPKGDFAIPLPRNYRAPVGAAYASVESSRGELGFYVVSDGTSKPHRVFMRTPSFGNLQALPALFKNNLISDSIASLGSMDFVLGDVDR